MIRGAAILTKSTGHNLEMMIKVKVDEVCLSCSRLCSQVMSRPGDQLQVVSNESQWRLYAVLTKSGLDRICPA